MSVILRSAQADDGPILATICYEAFAGISGRHGFPPDIPDVDTAAGLMGMVLSHPTVMSIVAERDGRPIGSSFLWLGEIDGVGPVTVSPDAQGSVGRSLMERTIAQSDASGSRGVRLVQAAFNTVSMALYTKLGFDVQEPLVCLAGIPLGRSNPAIAVSALAEPDLAESDDLCRNVHGHARTADLMGAIAQNRGMVARKDGRIVGTTTGIGFFGHTVAEDNDTLIALISAATEMTGAGFLLPSRNAPVFRWCLENGFRITQPMTLMSRGFYQEPKGAFMPSILF